MLRGKGRRLLRGKLVGEKEIEMAEKEEIVKRKVGRGKGVKRKLVAEKEEIVKRKVGGEKEEIGERKVGGGKGGDC